MNLYKIVQLQRRKQKQLWRYKLNNFEEVAIKQELKDMKVIRIIQDSSISSPNTGYYCLFEEQDEIYCGYLYFRKDYKQINPRELIKSIKSEINNVKESIKDLREQNAMYELGREVDKIKIINFIREEVGTMYEILHGDFDYEVFEEEKAKEMLGIYLKKGISPEKIFKKMQYKYDVYRKVNQKGFEIKAEIITMKEEA